MNTQFYDIATERACLAAAILKSDALEELSNLEPEIFHDARHRAVHAALLALHRDGELIDTMAIRAKLIEAGEYERLGGNALLAELLAEYPMLNVRYGIRTIKRLALRRRIVELTVTMRDMVQQPGVETDAIINQIEATIREMDEISREEFIDIKRMFDTDDVAGLYNVQGLYTKTGFDAIDSRLIGLFKGELIILAARPSVGKTALGLNIARKVADKRDVLFVSLEMSVSQLGLRMVSAEAMINSRQVRMGKINSREKDQLNAAAAKLRELKFTAVEQCTTLDHLVAKARKFAKSHMVGLIVIDYLQLIQVPGNLQRYVQVGQVSRALKHLARELDVPVLCLAQISREAEQRAPRLSDLRESGDIEQDADVVMFLHKDPNDQSNNVDVLFAKNRNGLANTKAQLAFKKELTQFADMDYSHTEEFSQARML